MKLSILLIYIMLATVTSAQDIPADFVDEQGKVYFLLGKAPPTDSDRLAIRIDTMLCRIYPYPNPQFDLHIGLNSYDQSTHGTPLKTAGKTNERGVKHSADISKIDTNYSSNTMTGHRLLALGNVRLRSQEANSVRWIDTDFSLGRVTTLDKYPNLRVLTQCHVYMNSRPCHSEFAPIRQAGDPFFWKELQACRKLEALSLNHLNGSELLFLDEALGEVIKTTKLHAISLHNVPYMPVNFHDFSSLKYVSFWMLHYPEAVNMAVIMNGYDNDTTTGNWSHYLAAAREKSVTLPETGAFRSHYSNDSLLCSGAFRNYLPHGNWEFRYDNGQLCQRRFYDMGKKTGNWLFLDPNGDTLTQFQYKDGRLVYREDRKKDLDHPCDNYEFSYRVRKTVVYNLEWKSDREVIISKRENSVVLPDIRRDRDRAGDTLSVVLENWHFAQDEWEYSWIYECKEKKYSMERHYKGHLGENPYFIQNVDKVYTFGGSLRDRYMNYITESSVDLLKNISEELKYDDDNPEKVMRLIYSKRTELKKKTVR